MPQISSFSEESIQKILAKLEGDSNVNCELPGNGWMHIEDNLPYLVVYRQVNEDTGIKKMINSGGAYLIIGNEDFEGYQRLLKALSHQLSSKFGSYMLFEMYLGSIESRTFYIKGPSQKISTTLELLKKELLKSSGLSEGITLSAEIKNQEDRQAEGDVPLISIKDAKDTGSLWVGLEIPPIFRDQEYHLYPLFFRKFRDFLVNSVQKAVYDFIRVQTTDPIKSYYALGRKSLKHKVFEIDKELADIEKSFQFLWLVSPVNIQNIKHTFFKSNYKRVLDYHYRLLPIDPDILKRKLYNLRIEDINDPAMSYIFHEKREELDQQITMLNERGSKNFFYNSIRLYKGIDNEICEQAELILQDISETEKTPSKDSCDATYFRDLALQEFDYFKSQDSQFKSKVHLRDDVNIMMVSQGELYIPSDYEMSATEAQALIQHEVGTHVLTYYNGGQQPLQQLSVGLADYDTLQEGLAVMSEYLIGGLTANRLRTLAGRVVAGKALMAGGDFQSIFRLLTQEKGFSAEIAFNITSRIMQGGGFIKDIIYLKGLVLLRNYLQEGGAYEPLLAGKFSLKHLEVVKELTERQVLHPPKLSPSYLTKESAKKRLQLIREGLPISQMINP
ncbi:MAG: flavohemoglobin expression-modulating QEGLA motif protein [Mesonia sp.]|uniref:flavohemoglobin expression-modulating QEGLA motif protein n=1 Tax=Mesonia sp. TaxID=1960830 RepID=UPI003F9D9440